MRLLLLILALIALPGCTLSMGVQQPRPYEQRYDQRYEPRYDQRFDNYYRPAEPVPHRTY